MKNLTILEQIEIMETEVKQNRYDISVLQCRPGSFERNSKLELLISQKPKLKAKLNRLKKKLDLSK